MSVTITNLKYHSSGDQAKRTATITGDSSYPNPAGYLLSASQFGLYSFQSIEVGETAGYLIAAPDLSSDPSSTHLHYFQGAAGTTGNTTATNGTSAVTGTGVGTVTSGAGTVTSGAGTGVSGSASAGITATVSGATVSWASNVATISAGGPTLAAHLLAGAYITDGTLTAMVLDNTALTSTTGTITTTAPAPTGVTVSAYRIPTIDSLTSTATTLTSTALTVSSLTATAAAQVQVAHNHTVGAAAGGEVPNGTDLSAVSFEITVYGN